MASKTKQLQTTLIQFYSHPVAKVSMELFLSIGAVMFFAIFAIRPTLVTMSDLIKEIEEKRQLDQQLGQKIAALSSVQTQYLAEKDKFTLLEESIPTQPKFEEALKIIEKIASDNKIVIQSMQVNEIPSDAEDNIPFEQKERISVPISVSVEGDFISIRSFVEDIKNNRRILLVDSILFSVSENREVKKLRANITINMQYFGVKGTNKATGATNEK